ncbi:MAG: VWA domain-containing protein [Deltaproteobacteria bacterium]|nr:VWA domain-containing protein [Deltaproteobacteria bacterium]
MWTRPLALVLCLAGLSAGPFALPRALGAQEARKAEERVWLGVENPEDGHVRRSAVSLLQVSGWAGSFEQSHLDIAIAIDVSRSTKNGSGVDVNRDGHAGDLGWRRRRSLWSYLLRPYKSSDAGDSILSAELEAVRRLIDSLDANRTRVGIVTFWEEAQVRSSLGNTSEEIEGALDFIAHSEPQGRTNMARAIEVSTGMLLGARDAPEERELAILLLSDDFPTVPPPAEFAAKKAIQQARVANRHRIRIYTFALGVGPDSASLESLALREVARTTHGVYTPLAAPGDIIHALPRIDLTGLAEIRIENRTTKEDARAIWVRPDGTFDGFVALRKGRNQLRVTALGPEGGKAVQDRIVFYRPRKLRTDEDREAARRELEELKAEIEKIRVESDLVREMERTRNRVHGRQIEVDVE